MTAHTIHLLTAEQAQAKRSGLVELLIDAVENGASVNFIQPMTPAKAEAWWDDALASHARGERLIFIGESLGRLDGTVQLILAPQENQAHRANLSKMLVHHRARRQGLGEALLYAAGLDQVRPSAGIRNQRRRQPARGCDLLLQVALIRHSPLPPRTRPSRRRSAPTRCRRRR